MILALTMIPVRSFGTGDPPRPPTCEESSTVDCRFPGSLDTLGALTKTNEFICVGSSVSCATTGTTYTTGQAIRIYTCTTDETPITVTYVRSNWWEGASGQVVVFPVTLTNCDTYVFTAKTKGMPDEPSCDELGPYVVGTYTANAVKIQITDAGSYIVPGSPSNTVRYAWCPEDLPPVSVTLEVYDKFNSVPPKRTIDGLPTTLKLGASYAEHLWDGMDSEGHPLTEAGSPYTLKLIGNWSGVACDTTNQAKVEEWRMDVGIEDTAGDTETLVTGVDERTVTTNNLHVKVSLLGCGEALKDFSVTSNIEVTNGPAGNERGCYVTPVHLFYTTPAAPYDIRYRVVMNQLTATTNVPPDGLKIDTVLDGTLNPWDMGPGLNSRQTNAVWEFGIDSLGNTNAVRRGLTETFLP